MPNYGAADDGEHRNDKRRVVGLRRSPDTGSIFCTLSQPYYEHKAKKNWRGGLLHATRRVARLLAQFHEK